MKPWRYKGVEVQVAWGMTWFKWYAVVPSGATLRTVTKKAMRKQISEMKAEGRA